MIAERAEAAPAIERALHPAVDRTGAPPRRWSRRATVAAFCGAVLFGASCTLLLDCALAPFSKPGFCGSCHEMAEQHARWQASPHHTNESGVQVTCVECHLPHRDDRIAHTTAKVWAGTKHAAVHFVGTYNGNAARRAVQESFPNDRCVKCHSNLTGCPSSQAVGIVHTTALQHADNRAHACVACHDALHGPRLTATPKKKYERGDNSFCQVCHINFQQEPFAVAHVKAGLSCQDCHGPSDLHAADEEHLTPADILYAKEKVNLSCMTAECHPRDRMEAEIGHRPFFAGADQEHPYCTDCHGQHRVLSRTRRWNKETRILIEVDGRPVSPDNPRPRKRPSLSGDLMM